MSELVYCSALTQVSRRSACWPAHSLLPCHLAFCEFAFRLQVSHERNNCTWDNPLCCVCAYFYVLRVSAHE